MADKSALYAFVAGEVSPAFYGRSDLAKHPLSLADVENFYIDYKGGLFSRAGTKFVSHLPDAEGMEFFRFRATSDDYTLVFTANKMRVIRAGGFILTGSAEAVSFDSVGAASVSETYTVGSLVYVSGYGYARVSAFASATLSLVNMFDEPIVGNWTIQKVYELATTIATPESYNYHQDLTKVIVTSANAAPRSITYVADDNWTIAALVENVPDAPTNLSGVAYGSGGVPGTGTASVIYAVTAVANEVESNASAKLGMVNIVNFTTTTGSVDLSWDAVAGAEYYNVYRSVVYPDGYEDTKDQLGYLGRTEGLTYVDVNRTPDFTKAPPRRVNFFSGANYPALYTRFQQRGIYAGLKKDPLSVVGANSGEQFTFRINNPPIATDAFRYTIDAESVRPIKHMLPLRYGLLLFTADTISQLRGGGDAQALTAVSAFAETQGYVSVADTKPIAVNLDVLFMSGLFSELNAMVYTEYTRSFETRDIMVLSSHLFSPENYAVQIAWAPEPHKMLYMVRKDGQLVTLTYERNQEVFGWARQRTKGQFKKVCVVREENRNTPYYLVQRRINGRIVNLIERQQPRRTDGYDKHWYVDCGLDNQLTSGGTTATFEHVSGEQWKLTLPSALPVNTNYGFYIFDGFFSVGSVVGKVVNLLAHKAPTSDQYYDSGIFQLAVGEWQYGQFVSSVSGLWHLEGETVSVQVDGDSYNDRVVSGGTVEVPQPGVKFTVGLGYRPRAKTLPLSLGNAIFEGRNVAVRRVALRVLQTKGLESGPAYDQLEMLPTRTDENWSEPLALSNDINLQEMLGGLGWDTSAQLCLQQQYPQPAAVLGLVYDLDIGE